MGTHPKIRVCHIASGDLWAGAEVQVSVLLGGLAATGEYDLRAVILNEGELASRLRKAGAEVLILDESRLGFRDILRQADRWLESAQPEILHTHRIKENVLGALLKRRGRARRLVRTVHGLSEFSRGLAGLKSRAYGYINRYASWRYFDRVITVSDDIRHRLGDLSSAATIHNAVDLPGEPDPAVKAEVRREFGLPPDAPVIGSAGRMVPVKQYDMFLRAAAQISEKRADARFLLFGDGPELDDLKALANDLGLGDRVQFTGFRDDILRALQALDVLLMTSRHEGIPTVALEAMALQLPVVSTDVGGMREVVDHGKTGYLAPRDDLPALIEHTLALLDDPGMRGEMGDRGRLAVVEEFSSDVLTTRVSALYRELVGR